jgi:ABC-2 type transport system ATP-binding protein
MTAGAEGARAEGARAEGARAEGARADRARAEGARAADAEWGAPGQALPETGAAEPVIQVEGVSRWFGNVVAVSDVSFEVAPGITGLLGPNGAGKTTLLRMMTGLAATSTGTVRVFGEPVRDNPPLYRRIGVMSEHETVYGFLKGRDFVRMMGRLRGVPELDAAVERAIELGDLREAAGRPMGTYSRGMRQRMRLAATLVHDPELLVLDEPLNGADPRQRVHFQDLLHRLAADGRTIVISSHILEEVEQLADTVMLVINGKLAASGGFRAIRAALDERPYHVRVVCDAPRALASAVMRLESVDAVSVDPDDAVVILSRKVRELQLELPRLARSSSIRLRRVEPLDDSLESVFGYLVER